MAEGTQKTSTVDFILSRIKADAERKIIARQTYEKEYASGEQILPWALKTFLDGLPRRTSAGEALNELAKQGGNMRAVYERAPSAIPAIVEHIARVLKLSPEAVKAALGLSPLPHDGLDTLLLNVVHDRAHEARNGLLPSHCIIDAVNVGCGLNGGLTPKIISGRLRVLGYAFTSHHPVSVILIPRLLPPVLDATLTRLLPSPEEPRENGSHTHTERTVTSPAYAAAGVQTFVGLP